MTPKLTPSLLYDTQTNPPPQCGVWGVQYEFWAKFSEWFNSPQTDTIYSSSYQEYMLKIWSKNSRKWKSYDIFKFLPKSWILSEFREKLDRFRNCHIFLADIILEQYQILFGGCIFVKFSQEFNKNGYNYVRQW